MNKSFVSSHTKLVICYCCEGHGRTLQENQIKTCKICNGSGRLKKVSTYYKFNKR